MQVITDLHDRDLYARLRTDAELRRALDTNIEPWHMPHFQPAEAATEVGADDTPRSNYEACNAGLFKVLAAVLFVWAAGVTVLVLQ